MEKLVLLVALLFVFNGTLADEFVIKSSLSEIVKSFFSEKRLYFLIDESADGEILNQVLSENFNVTVQIERFNEIKQQPQRRRNVVILIESFDSFARLDDILTDTQFNFDGFFLIVCLNINRNQMNSMFRRLWEKFIYNVSLLSCCSNGLVTLQTFMPFNVENCFDTNSKVINVFHQETKRWKTKDFFPRKFENLYNCPIRFTSYEYAPAVMATRFKNGSFALKGCDIEFLKGLQSILNFQVNLNFLDTWGVLFENGTGTGAHKLLLENSSDVTIGWGFWSYSKKFYISSTEEYFMVPLGFIIPYGRSFTSFEKLFIPFQMKVWILFTLVIILAICVILFVEGRGRKFRAIFIGDNVKQPLMELLAALFGGSSHVEPRKHHPRYLLMIFLLFCLVMRTLYQSGLFKFMQSDQKGSDVTSINEMIDERYTIYSYQAYEPTWRSMKFSPMYDSAFGKTIVGLIFDLLSLFAAQNPFQIHKLQTFG